MDKKIAIEIMEELLEARRVLSGVEKIAQKMQSREEFAYFMRSVLCAVAEIEEGPVRKVVKEYPELMPSFMKL